MEYVVSKKTKGMAYKRRAKKKADLRENPEQVDTSMGRYYLEMGLVKIIDKQDKTIRIKTL